MNWIVFLIGTTVGAMLGAGATISAMLLVSKALAKAGQDCRRPGP